VWFGDAMVRSGRERVYEDMGEPVLFGAMSACSTRADWGYRKNRFGVCSEQERKSQDDGSHQAVVPDTVKRVQYFYTEVPDKPRREMGSSLCSRRQG